MLKLNTAARLSVIEAMVRLAVAFASEGKSDAFLEGARETLLKEVTARHDLGAVQREALDLHLKQMFEAVLVQRALLRGQLQ